jgi:hypothetical protein
VVNLYREKYRATVYRRKPWRSEKSIRQAFYDCGNEAVQAVLEVWVGELGEEAREPVQAVLRAFRGRECFQGELELTPEAIIRQVA